MNAKTTRQQQVIAIMATNQQQTLQISCISVTKIGNTHEDIGLECVFAAVKRITLAGACDYGCGDNNDDDDDDYHQQQRRRRCSFCHYFMDECCTKI